MYIPCVLVLAHFLTRRRESHDLARIFFACLLVDSQLYNREAYMENGNNSHKVIKVKHGSALEAELHLLGSLTPSAKRLAQLVNITQLHVCTQFGPAVEAAALRGHPHDTCCERHSFLGCQLTLACCMPWGLLLLHWEPVLPVATVRLRVECRLAALSLVQSSLPRPVRKLQPCPPKKAQLLMSQ